METEQLLQTGLRALLVYVALLAVIRLLGKRTVGNFTAFDLLVALMLGEVVDEIIYGDVTLLQGAVVVGVITLAQYTNTWLNYWDHGLNRILEGEPTAIVRDGKMLPKGMREERMNEQEVLAELRLKGVDDLDEVKLANVETDGKVSVLLQEWAQPLTKDDLQSPEDETEAADEASSGRQRKRRTRTPA